MAHVELALCHRPTACGMPPLDENSHQAFEIEVPSASSVQPPPPEDCVATASALAPATRSPSHVLVPRKCAYARVAELEGSLDNSAEAAHVMTQLLMEEFTSAKADGVSAQTGGLCPALTLMGVPGAEQPGASGVLVCTYASNVGGELVRLQ